MSGITAVSLVRPGANTFFVSLGRFATRRRLIRNAATAVIAATLLLAAVPGPLAAQQIAFTGNGTFDSSVPTTSGLAPGDFSFSFLLPQNPTPSLFNAILFNFASTTGVFTQGGTGDDVTGRLTFFTDGGFTFRPSGESTLINEFGPTLFTGPTSNPTFTPGDYTSFESGNRNIVSNASITSTPEPGSIALLGTGLIGVIPMARKKRKV